MILTNDMLGRSFNENEIAHCTFEITGKGLVFADPDHTYLCLTGKTIEDLGKTSSVIFGSTENDHADKLFSLCRILGGSASLPKKYPCGAMRYDTASICGGKLMIVSAPCNDNCNFTAGRSERYIGAITAAKKDTGFAAEYFSAGLSELFGIVRSITDLSGFLSRNIEYIAPDAVLRSVIENNRPADICSVCSSVSRRGRRAVHISAVPLGDGLLMISFFSPIIAEDQHEMTMLTASGTVTETGGVPVLCGMTAYLGAMLERREITLPFILSSAEKVRESGETMSFPYGGKDGVTMFAAPCTNDPEMTRFTVCENEESAVGYGINLPELTKREYAVMYHTANGLSNTEIAEILGVAEGTVSKLLYHSYKKLNIASRTNVAHFFQQASAADPL